MVEVWLMLVEFRMKKPELIKTFHIIKNRKERKSFDFLSFFNGVYCYFITAITHYRPLTLTYNMRSIGLRSSWTMLAFSINVLRISFPSGDFSI